MKYIFLVDSCADLPAEYIKDKNIQYIPMKFSLNGKIESDDFGSSLNYKEFFNAMRDGALTTTSQINVLEYYEVFKKWTEKGYGVLYLGFSSGLSGSINSSMIAKNQLLDEGLGENIYIVDSKCASLGYGLLIYYTNLQREKGASLNEIAEYAENLKYRVNHYFTVEDLVYLYRGGRVTKATKTFGNLLNIKPVLHVDDEGKLIPLSKVKGRKKSLKCLSDFLIERIEDFEDNTIAISHGDCLDDANFVISHIREKFPSVKVITNNIGPVIGSHSGPGTVALFFIGKGRK